MRPKPTVEPRPSGIALPARRRCLSFAARAQMERPEVGPVQPLWSLVASGCLALCIAYAPSAQACQPPRPGERMPTESELRTRYKEEADSILVARAIERGDNGKANPTAFEGEGWATLAVLHTLKGTARKKVRYRLGGCGYGGTWNTHIPLDRHALLFLKGDFVFYGVELPSGRSLRIDAENVLRGGAKTPVPR